MFNIIESDKQKINHIFLFLTVKRDESEAPPKISASQISTNDFVALILTLENLFWKSGSLGQGDTNSQKEG